MALIVSVVFPVSVSVSVWVSFGLPGPGLAKVTLAADRLATGADVMPLPVKTKTCGPLATLSTMVRAPVRLPVLVGENVTLIWQLAPTEMPLPQLFDWAKSPLVPMF